MSCLKKLIFPRALSMDELPLQVVIANVTFDIEMMGNYYGLLSQRDYFINHNNFEKCYWEWSDIYNRWF